MPGKESPRESKASVVPALLLQKFSYLCPPLSFDFAVGGAVSPFATARKMTVLYRFKVGFSCLSPILSDLTFQFVELAFSPSSCLSSFNSNPSTFS